jgi:hypothetical protein
LLWQVLWAAFCLFFNELVQHHNAFTHHRAIENPRNALC